MTRSVAVAVVRSLGAASAAVRFGSYGQLLDGGQIIAGRGKHEEGREGRHYITIWAIYSWTRFPIVGVTVPLVRLQ